MALIKVSYYWVKEAQSSTVVARLLGQMCGNLGHMMTIALSRDSIDRKPYQRGGSGADVFPHKQMY